MAATIQISMDAQAPEFFSEIERVENFLASTEHQAIDLCMITKHWELRETYGDIEKVRQRIDEFKKLTARPNTVLDIPFKVQPVDPIGQSGSISTIAQKWDQQNGKLNSVFIGCLRRTKLLERMILLAADDSSNDLVYSWIGKDIGERMGPKWRATAMRQPLHSVQQHDNIYDRWVASQYLKTFSQDSIDRHFVDAIIRKEDGNIPYRVNYDRLVARCELINGQPALMIVSAISAGLLPLVQNMSRDHATSQPHPSISSTS